MTTCTFRVVVEPNEDPWCAYCPGLEAGGASTCGDTRRHIREVLEMLAAELLEDGKSLPADATRSEDTLTPCAAVAVSIGETALWHLGWGLTHHDQGRA